MAFRDKYQPPASNSDGSSEIPPPGSNLRHTRSAIADAARAECISWKIAIRFGRPRYFTAVSPIINEMISTTQPDPLAEAVNRDGKAHIPLAFDGHVLVFHGLKLQHHSQHDSFCLAHRLLTKRADS